MLVSRQDAFLATCNLYQFILLRLVSLSCKIYQLQILLVLLDLFIIMEDIIKFFWSWCFNEGIDSSGCREISFNCLKNLEAKVMKIYEQRNENKNMHIKGEKQLVDLAESVKLMISKFDKMEKDRKEKEKVVYLS